VSGPRLPRLRPLADGHGSPHLALGEEPASDGLGEIGEGAANLGRSSGSALIEAELESFCRTGGLVYAALIDEQGRVAFSICTVGSRPHNECEIGELASGIFASARALGAEIGEPAPLNMSVQGTRWGYSLDRLQDGHLLVGVFPCQALPAIVRASAYKTKLALESALGAGG